MVNYAPFLQVVKENRSYTLLLPNNAPFDECHDALLEMAQQVLQIKEIRLKEAEELEKKKQEEQSSEVAG